MFPRGHALIGTSAVNYSLSPYQGIVPMGTYPIKLIVHVPAGTCLDRDFCCKIVPSLTLGNYLHSISPYSTNSACSQGDYALIGTDAV